MRWERPDWPPNWLTFVGYVAFASALMFTATWLGYGNNPGAPGWDGGVIRWTWGQRGRNGV
jgi:hypothetical protein